MPAPAVELRPRVIPGLDGLRALAIIAVFIYHLNPTWLPGGFVGVDMFFVISGFLITTLLLREQAANGRVDLGQFWLRRARRLLPALLLCVTASIWLARVVQTDLLVGIDRQTFGALTFSTNWVEIIAGSNYFTSTSPQLFMNFWSLAVEEQFYLLWPLVMIGLTAAVPSLTRRAGLAVATALGSAVLMALLFDPTAATRVYYGTDTHLFGLMLGAGLAFAWAGPQRAWLDSPVWVRGRPWILGAALATLAVCLVALSEERALTFRGGLLLASVAVIVIIAATIDRPGRLRQVLDHPVLAAIGQRSYGLYLWHWPVILVVNHDLPSTPGTLRFVLTRVWVVLVTWAIADLSLRFVETPVRKYGFRGALARLRPTGQWGRVPVARIGIAAVLVWVVGTGAWIATAPSQTSTQRMIEANAAEAAGARDGAVTALDASFTMPKGKEIDVFGDSMAVGVVPALKYYFPGIQIDAKSNRHWSDGLTQVTAAGDTTRRAVVLAFGTNAGTPEADLRAVLDQLGPQRMVVVVNVHLPRSTRAVEDNATLDRVAQDYANVEVADWNRAVSASPASLQPDGIHPSLTGAHLYVSTIRQAMADLSERHTGEAVKLKKLPIP